MEKVELAKKHNATDILKRFETLDFVSQLASVSDEQRRPKTLALRNGDFELGLDVYWDAWKCSGGCFSEAKTDDYTRPGAIGENSLRIQHHTQRSTKSFATLQQAIPVLTGTRYRISVWAKSDEMAADGLNIVLDDILHEPLIVLPEGKYDWQLLTGEFFVTGALDLDHPDTRRIKIVSSAPGKVWLDDVQIERMID